MGLTRPRAHQLQDIDYKQTARAVTVANVTLSGGAPATVDGTSLALRDRVLVTAQTTGSENGIYYVTTVGAGSNGTWARSLDADATGEIKAGTIIMITEGTTYADTQWKLTTDDPITVGSTTMTFVRSGNAAYGTFAVAGQNSIVADQIGDTLTMVAGTNIALTTNDSTDTLTVTPSLTPTLTTATFTNTTTNDTILLTTTEDSSTAAPVITMKRNSASPADADYLGQLKFQGENDADQEVVYAKITGKIQDASDGSEDGIIEFANQKAGSNVITARLRSDSLQLLNGTTLVVAGLTYPTADGTSGQAIITDASGNLSFGDVSGGGGTGRVTFNYAITGADTTITGADSQGNTLSYTAGQLDVFVNGVRMAPADITATNGSSVVFADALASGDIVDIISYTAFDVVTNNASDLSSGTVPSARVAGAYTGITSVGTLTGFTSTGIDDNATSTAITIDSAEKVGIGISNPASYDDGGDRLVVGDTGGRSGITIVTGTSNDGSINFADGTSGTAPYMGFINYHHNTNTMKLATNAGVRLVIDNNGKVGIGDTAPDGLLTIKGDSNSGAQPSIRLKDGTDAREAFLTNESGDLVMGTSNSSDDVVDSSINILTSLILLKTVNTERMRINGDSRVFFGTTTSNVASANQFGVVLNDNSAGSAYLGTVQASANGNGSLFLNRGGDDGALAIFKQAGTDEGSISVSGNTVSYNSFSGSHWSRLTDNSKPTILKGTVIETIDEMCDWYDAQFTVLATEDAAEYVMNDPIALPAGKSVGDTITHTYDGTAYSATIIKEGDNKHTKCKISDTADSKRVYGVYADWDNDDDTVNDMYVTAVGTHVVRINKDVTVSAGDLLSSNGDGTAKVQDDDIIRSKTIGKVLTNIKQETYSDGSYTVPCALYCG